MDRVRACLAVVAETGTPLMIGFNRRFDPHFAAVKRAIDEGRIGAVEQVVLTRRDPGLPHLDYLPRSGGLFRDMTIYDFVMARFLLCEEIETVFATTFVLVDPRVGELGDVDTASIVLRTASGRQAVITNSRRATYGYDQRIEVHGSAGMVSAENQHEASVTVATGDGYTRPPVQNFFHDALRVGLPRRDRGVLELVEERHADEPLRRGRHGRTRARRGIRSLGA